MDNIQGEKIVFANGVSLEQYIKGIIKNLDEARIPPINFISVVPGMTSFTTTHQQITFANPHYACAMNSDVFGIDNNILKIKNGHDTFETVNVHGVLQFNTVNNTGSEQQMYLSLVPRYYLSSDPTFSSPTEWTNHTMQHQLVIPTGTRRASFPFSTFFTIGENTTGFDFVIYAASDVENLSYTFTRSSYVFMYGLSGQYQ